MYLQLRGNYRYMKRHCDARCASQAEPPRDAQPQRDVYKRQSQRRVTNADLSGYSNWQLTLMRNEIYARHGRQFDNSHIRGQMCIRDRC